jgi:hypothetical protein
MIVAILASLNVLVYFFGQTAVLTKKREEKLRAFGLS